MASDELTPREILQAAAEQLRQDFEEIRKCNPHAGEGGAEAELILAQFLRERIPKRFDVQSGVVLGTNGAVSKQTDLIVYDALNSPVYRKGSRIHILPRDNVAAVIEVKSKLNKKELADAAVKIASVKAMRPSPISELDQPATSNRMIMANTLGVVFAYESYTSMDALAENLREINEQYDSKEWIDLVVVLGKGILSYAVQIPFGRNFQGWFGGPTDDEFLVSAIYVHLTKNEDKSLVLNHFYLKLISHLAFFRNRTTLDFDGLLGREEKQIMTIQGYQYDLKRKLVPVEKSHESANFQNPKIRFNLYSKRDRNFLGQVCYLPWQDGAVITCSVTFSHQVVFQHYFTVLKQKAKFMRSGGNYNMWLSSVVSVTENEFILASTSINPEIISVRGTDSDDPPTIRLFEDC